MKELIEENYKSIVKRGLITPETSIYDFINKIYEEVNELEEAELTKDVLEEMADVILTVLNFARHLHLDIEKALKDKIQINKNR